ncbi:MAG: hypothetical protein ACE5PT_04955 [Gemmatimonadales bacterium]
MSTTLLLVLGVSVLAAAIAIWLSARQQYRTELSLSTFAIRSSRELRVLGGLVRLSHRVVRRSTHLTAAATTRSGPGQTDERFWVLIRGHAPGLRGVHGYGKHITRFMQLDTGAGPFAQWAAAHPGDRDRLLHMVRLYVDRHGANTTASELVSLLFEGSLNGFAGFENQLAASTLSAP